MTSLGTFIISVACLCQRPFLHILRRGSFLTLYMCCIVCIDFHRMKQCCIPEVNPMITMSNHFTMSNSNERILLRRFVIQFIKETDQEFSFYIFMCFQRQHNSSFIIYTSFKFGTVLSLSASRNSMKNIRFSLENI